MEEWERHVKKDDFGYFCGAHMNVGEWHFVDEDHAMVWVELDTTVQPCKQCYKIIINKEGK